MRARHALILAVSGALFGPAPAVAQWNTDVTTAVAPARPAAAPDWPRLIATQRMAAGVGTSSAAAPQGGSAGWPKTEVELARARCRHVLKGLDLVAKPEEPLLSGKCGTPAPVTLVSVGSNPQITFTPPVIVTCDMAVAVHGWITKALQPLARKHLGSPLVAIETMSSYSCRNAYGRADTKLSEHGRANALDISGFVTANAQGARLVADWGTTERDKAQAIAATQRQEQLEAARLAAEARGNANARRIAEAEARAKSEETADATASGPIDAVRATIHEGMPKGLSILPNLSGDARSAFGFGPSRLGGPGAGLGRLLAPPPILVETAGRTAAAVTVDKSRFLREAHVTACRIFGTVLGPEANNAHRNHFHVDLADRGGNNFCQ